MQRSNRFRTRAQSASFCEQEALKESEKKYRFLADNAKDVIWIRDMDLKLTYVSPSVEIIRGYTPEEAIRQEIHNDSRIQPQHLPGVCEKVIPGPGPW
jgi:PAS domain-containing protein